jgi:hypothetical protein
MSCSCSSTNSSNTSSLLNGVQNQLLDTFNRTTYLSSPYSIGPPLSTYTPSTALSVSPVQGCGGYSFVSPGLGPLAAPLGVNLAAANGLGMPVSPGVGVVATGLPSVGGGNPFVSVPGANTGVSVSGNGFSTNVGSGATLNVPPGTTTINVNPNGNNTNQNGGSVGPVSPYSSVLNAPTQGGSVTIQRPQPQPQNSSAIVGVPVSARNLTRATGDATYNNNTSNICPNQQDDGSFSPACNTGCNTGTVQTVVNNPPPPIPVAPGVVAGGVGGIALASPAFLGGTPNINVTSGIAFANDCGTSFGLSTPLAIPGPIAPPVNVLGSNYLNNFASQPYYSGLNNSEPAALMNSANPMYPGFVMLARAWNGTPQVIISKPDKNGCPTFETLCPFENHQENCACPSCDSFCIDKEEYNCINGFGGAVPGTDFTSSILISPLGTVTTKTVNDNEYYFIVRPAVDAILSSDLACRNTRNLTISVNGAPNRNILMYKGCKYTVRFGLDTDALTKAGIDVSGLKTLKLIFTKDPAGYECGDCSSNPTCCACTDNLVDCNFNPSTGLPIGGKTIYTPTCDCHSGCLTTIYYQLLNVAYAGGPITIL